MKKNLNSVLTSISIVILVGGLGSRFSSFNEPPKQLSKLNKNLILINILNNFKDQDYSDLEVIFEVMEEDEDTK